MAQEFAQFTPSQVTSLIVSTYKALQAAEERSNTDGCFNIFIWAQPGVGKTTISKDATKSLSEMLNAPVTWAYRSLAQEEAVDSKGVPYIEIDERGNRITKYALPHWFPTDPDSKGIIIIDDLPHGMLATQHAALELCGPDRSLNGVRLPDGWMIVATGNRIKDRAGAGKVMNALGDRFVHIEMTVDLDDWTTWAFDNHIQPEVVAFNRFKKDALNDFDPGRNELVFATPRAWANVSHLIPHLPDDLLYGALTGLIGQGLAIEFTAFLRVYRDLPDPDECLLNPDGAPIPRKLDVLYALAGALCVRVTSENASRFVRFSLRLRPEWSVLMMDYALKTKASSAVQTCREFDVWLSKYGSIIGIS
jgi:hypothetical protein